MVMDSILFLCLDSLTYKVFMDAETPNMNAFGLAHRAHSFACTTGPSIMGYMMNKPPIGIGLGLFEVGEYVPAWGQHREIRQWMPRYYSMKGYATAWLSGNPVLTRIDEGLNGALQGWFKYWKTTEYLKPVATPDIIKDLKDIVQKEKDRPIFACLLLLDTHTPYHDGSKLCPFDPYRPKLNYENQVRATEYVDRILSSLLLPFKEVGRPLKLIITSDHGENYGGREWGHNPFRPHLKFSPQLFEIPFIKTRIEDWDKIKIG